MLISRKRYKIETLETRRVKTATARSTACRRQPTYLLQKHKEVASDTILTMLLNYYTFSKHNPRFSAWQPAMPPSIMPHGNWSFCQKVHHWQWRWWWMTDWPARGTAGRRRRLTLMMHIPVGRMPHTISILLLPVNSSKCRTSTPPLPHPITLTPDLKPNPNHDR